MIVSFNDENVPDKLTADICIVGSGAASLALLSRFYHTSLKIIVLEAGGENITDRDQKLYDVITPYHPFEGARNGRFRVFGGSTTQWGGQSLPFDEIDFKQRHWVPFSGWPFTYDQVAHYYKEVDKFLQVHEVSYQANIFQLIHEKPLLENEDVALRFSKWSPYPNLREVYRKQIIQSTNITLVQNANLVEILLTENQQVVQEVRFCNLHKRVGCVQAKHFILACGGIENPRLLLASNKQSTKGIGNVYDNVGSYLQDHPNAHVGSFVKSVKKVQSYFNYFYLGKTRFLPRLILSEKIQQERKILNASASLLFITGDEHPFSVAKELYRKQARGRLSQKDVKTVVKLVKYIPQLLQTGKHFLWDKKVYTPNASLQLNLMLECPPVKDNRVSLSNELDELGMPKAIVSWQMNDLIFHTIKESAQLLQAYLNTTALGTFKIADWVLNEDWNNRLGDAKHHIGTTRMAATEREGVVDANCKVFGLNNLYISGSSVFPTSSHSNPTATLIALAFRLADHLKHKING